MNGSSSDRGLDSRARELVEGQLALARGLAYRQYRNAGGRVPLDELIGEAFLALTYAATMFDESLGVPFGAFATLVLKQRLPRAVKHWQRAMWNQSRFVDMGEKPGDDRAFEPACSQDRSPEDSIDERDLVEFVFAREAESPWLGLLREHIEEGTTYAEIGRRVGLSRERVRQCLVRVSKRLRWALDYELA